jgi:hypothetical protein
VVVWDVEVLVLVRFGVLDAAYPAIGKSGREVQSVRFALGGLSFRILCATHSGAMELARSIRHTKGEEPLIGIHGPDTS